MICKVLLQTKRAKLIVAMVVALLVAMLAISNYGTHPAHAQSAPGCNGPWGPGNWPPACWQPYADTSPFNTPLPPNSQLVSNSEQITDRIFSVRDPNKPLNDPTQGIARRPRPNHLVANPAGTAGEPTYYSKPSDPNFKLHCEADPFGRPDGKCPIEGVTIDIPAGAGIEEPSGSDHHLTVVDQAKGVEYDLWQVKAVDEAGPNPKEPVVDKLPAGLSNDPNVVHDLYASWGGRMDLYGSGLLDHNDKPFGWVGDATAAHFGSLAGRLRAEELVAGQINHALFIGVDCVGGAPVYPAQGQGRLCSTLGLSETNAPPMGTRLRLNMSEAQINGLNIDPWKKTILHALRKYGAFIGDTGSEGYFAIEAEAGVQYKTYGEADKWYTFGQALDVNGRTNWELYTPSPGVNEYIGKLYNDGNDPKPGQSGYVNWESQVWENMEVVDPDVSRDTVAPTIINVAPVPGSTGISPGKNVYALFSEAMQRSGISGSTFTLIRKGTTTPISASISYDGVSKKAILDPSRNLRPGATYVVTVKGGSSGVKDLAGNPLAADKIWKFTVRR
jgi:hypothetical protein